MKTAFSRFAAWALRIFLCACAVPLLAASPQTKTTADDAATVQQLIETRGKLREDELARRAQDEADRWAKAKHEGVVSVKTIKKSGEIDKRIDVVIFSDGFRRDEMRAFSQDAARAAIQLLRAYPYSEYKDFFNFHVVGVASKDSGVSTERDKRDTAFGSTVHEDGGLVADLPRLEKYVDIPPDLDLGIVLVNTTMERARSSARGPFVTLRLGGEIGRTAAHELGHAFGNLADEYEESRGGPANPEEPAAVNVTAESNPPKVKWHYWIEATGGEVGLYEGANLFHRGYYRPERECLMRHGERFCRVCLEEMIRRMYESVPPIDAASPLGYEVSLTEGEKREVSVRTNGAPSAPVTVEWFVDGASQGRGANAFVFSGLEFKVGEHEVMARAISQNRNVLRDKGLLESGVFWKVKVLPGNVPTIEAPPKPLTVNAGEELRCAVRATEGDAGHPLMYKIERAPDGLAINAATGEIAWKPDESQAGGHLAVVTASDGANEASAEIPIGVEDKDARQNRMPVIEFVPIQDVSEGELIEFRLKATDLDGDSVIYNLKDAPSGADFDRETGKFHWRPSFSQVGEYKLKFEAWDGKATDTYEVPVIVKDELFSESDIASAERDVSRGDRDAFAAAFYALRSKNPAIRRLGITMLRTEGAKSSIAELYRLMRDGDADVAASAAGALLATVRDKLAPEDSAYFSLLLNDVFRTAKQMEDEREQLAKLKEILGAVAEKAADKGIKNLAGEMSAWLDKITR